MGILNTPAMYEHVRKMQENSKNRDNTLYARNATLRDYFAAKALPQLLFGRASDEFNNCACAAYKMADAMMKVREAK
jgi:hypothetical protein